VFISKTEALSEVGMLLSHYVWRRVARILMLILYIPSMLVLIGLSMWWFQGTESDITWNPVVLLLWYFICMIPGLIGFCGLALGPILMSE
jgi:hypothetical protein